MSDKKLYFSLLKQMKAHLIEADTNNDDVVNNFGIGEVNITLLAEEIIDDLDDTVLDETHVVWDAAVDAGEWFEAHYRREKINDD